MSLSTPPAQPSRPSAAVKRLLVAIWNSVALSKEEIDVGKKGMLPGLVMGIGMAIYALIAWDMHPLGALVIIAISPILTFIVDVQRHAWVQHRRRSANRDVIPTDETSDREVRR